MTQAVDGPLRWVILPRYFGLLGMQTASPRANENRAYTERLVSAFKQVDLLIPPWVSMGFISEFAHSLEVTPVGERSRFIRATLPLVYNTRRLSTFYVSRYTQIRYVRAFQAQIDQAIKAHFSGLDVAAVSTLVPVIEGIVREIAVQHDRDVGRGTKKLNREFEAMVERELNSPDCYGERLVMLESLRDFVRDRFLRDTKTYNGRNEFNRHGILHGIFKDFGEDVNFYRLITLLDSLCFCIGLLHGGISVFAPDETPESVALKNHYERLIRFATAPGVI